MLGLIIPFSSSEKKVGVQLKAGHRWFESRPVQQEPGEIQTIYVQADCTRMSDFYMRLMAAAVVTSNNHYVLLARAAVHASPLGEHNGSVGGISPINADCVDGGIKRLQERKIASSMVSLTLECRGEDPAGTGIAAQRIG